MTVMLERLRQLDAARKRGELTDAQYADARSKLLSLVEDADLEPAGSKPSRPRPRRPAPAAASSRAAPSAMPVEARRSDTAENSDMSFFWGLCLVGLCAAGLMTFLVGQLIGDITIALTLAVTVFAAVVIAAFQRMQS